MIKLASHTQAELNAKGLSEKQIETFALKDMTTQADIDCITKIFNEINCKEALDALGQTQHDTIYTQYLKSICTMYR